MYVVFVTGPLASGKRSACLYLSQHGFAHIDLDLVAKEFLDDELVQQQVIEAYGTSVANEDGGINKARLAELAFADEESTVALNSIIWPLVSARLSDLVVGENCQKNQTRDRLVVEIPMLAEAPGMLDLADTILCITADENVRITRALARGMHLDDIKRRIALQATDDERAALADVVIENNGTVDALHAKLDSWLRLQQQEHLF